MKLSSLVITLAALLAVAPAHAGPVKGTLLSFPVVQPGHAVMFSGVELLGGHVTDVWATAKGGSIRCSVFNEKGAPVVLDAGEGNKCSIKVEPKKTGRYTVLVTNIDSTDPAATTVVIQ